MLGHVLRTLFCLTMFTIISACTAATVGGATDGGYYAGQYEHNTGISAEDAEISRVINEHYVKDPLVSAFDVHVDTHRGVVNLSGTVPSQRAARQAVSLANSVDGVSRVINQLKIVPSEAGR